VEARKSAGNIPGGRSFESSFDDLRAEIESPRRGILFHDGNNRSMEQLMADQAKNAMMHNLAVELLRKQYSSLEAALRERIG
jgi:flagellar basal body rod protein FlgB